MWSCMQFVCLHILLPLLTFSLRAASVNRKAVFVLTEEGGHLGFYEGGILIPNAVTWMDRVIVQYIDTVRKIQNI